MNEDLDGVLELRVEQLRRESDGVLSVTLADPEGGALPAWAPGAHIDLEFPGMVRQYSLCGDPADRFTYKVAVLREEASRGGSAHIHEVLRPGDLVEVGGPRNHFALVPAPRYLFVGGGIGITPLLPMLAGAEAEGVAWTLVYGGRSRATMGFLDDLARHGTKVRVVPEDESGRLDLDALLAETPAGTAIYTCGPGGLLDALAERCAALGRSDDLHLERFQAKTFDIDPSDEHAFDVVCGRSGLTVEVPADRSILSSLEEAGIGVPWACQDGICGSCEVKILDGAADHRDSLLTPAQQESGQTLMVCVSRALGDRLVLDL
ncbi:ferredoxin-NADP reductase [Actinocorallia herbida]|uniref:Ferredoxin-NADP reductase n=1 Tax=Actinocorallia herbida TaxID=58109 RepID=A0A3N1D0R4_9ACTN|nr:PDR/VanB family oxidoreductase [Actinocorallia herbida]ROO87111.1 ferredoxin-NADP reductase [Actinocorallia herbida]